jgi:hypothetical protein
MAMLTAQGEPWPETLKTNSVTIVCKDIKAVVSKTGYKYSGVMVKQDVYMTELNSDELSDLIVKRCY